MRVLLLGIAVFALLVLLLGPIQLLDAAPVQDDDNGLWAYNFSDSSGVSSSDDVTISNGNLTLGNASGGSDPPYNVSGYIITTSIMPLSVAEWGNITFNATVPDNTSIRIQVLDEGDVLYPDSRLTGNTNGFSTSPINLSELHVDLTAGTNTAKFGRLRIKVTLNTTNTSVTPVLNDLNLSWVVSRGEIDNSSLANTSWPTTSIDTEGTGHTPYYMDPQYPAIRWVRNMGTSASGFFTRGESDVIFFNLHGSVPPGSSFGDGKLMALNRTNGETIWERTISGWPYSTDCHALTQNGTIYINDIYNDVLIAYNGTDGSLKWTYQFSVGHSNEHVVIGDDGTLFITRYNGDFTAYAFYPNGTVKWNTTVDPGTVYVTVGFMSLNNGTVYLGSSTIDGSYNHIDLGKLYALNETNGSIIWEYPTGNIAGARYSPVIDSDGTIYTAHYSTNGTIEKKIYAIHPNGTLKWNRSVGITNESWYKLILRPDGILLADRVQPYPSRNMWLEAINTSNGSLVWSGDVYVANSLSEFSDGLNGIYSTIEFLDMTNFTYANSYLYYHDSENNQKWRIHGYDRALDNLMQDEDGRVYANHFYRNASLDKIFSIYPWTLSGSSDPSNPYHPGKQITFTANTSMQPTNLLTGDANKIQVYVDNNDKVLLSYSSTADNNDTIWTASYVIPYDMALGNHTYTVEASAAGIETDIFVYFDSAAQDSNNTGINDTGSFYVTACSSDADCSPRYCVHGICRTSKPWCGDSHCDSGEFCYSCPGDCGICFGGGSPGGGAPPPSTPDENDTDDGDDGTGSGAGPSCGDGLCGDGETRESCPDDCEEPVEVPVAGNGTHEEQEGTQPELVLLFDELFFDWFGLVLLFILALILMVLAHKEML